MRECSFDGCHREYHGRGLCSTHLRQLRRTGEVRAVREYRGCLVTGCEAKHCARGYCKKHYRHWYQGQMRPASALRDIREDYRRFQEKYAIDPETGCWNWLNALGRNGYGRFHMHGRLHTAHRVSWEMNVGPIPAGLHIDHLCRNRRCVNPDHLEPVTVSENNRRARLAA